MDINSLMNRDAPGSSNTRNPPAAQDRPRSPSRSLSIAHNTPPLQPQQFIPRPAPPAYPQPPQPPALDTRAQPPTYHQQPHLTPLRTPSSYGSAASQYPFPHQYGSPAQAHPADRFPAVTPGGRSSSQFYSNQQGSPTTFSHPPPPPLSGSHSNASATPSSVHSHSPFTTRESPHPGSSLSHQAYPQAHHPSQPSTPLGPPPLQFSRTSTHGQRDAVSPYPSHQRSYSGTSTGPGRSIASNSPAPSNLVAGNLAASPASFVPPLHYQKRTSTEYILNEERERSISVSPKTQVFRRQPSGGSRQGSQDPWSARPSVSDHRPTSSEQRLSAQPLSHIPQPSKYPIENHGPSVASPLSQARSHTSQTPNLHRLLSNESHISAHQAPYRQHSIDSQMMHGLSEHSSPNVTYGEPPGFSKGSLLQQPMSQPYQAVIPEAIPHKRPAEGTPESHPEPKKARRRYAEPPIWARLAPSNPRYDGQQRTPQNTIAQAPGKSMPPQHLTKSTAVQQAPKLIPRTNGQPVPTQPPQLQQSAPPAGPSIGQLLGEEKARVERVLGMPWEVSITDTKPMDSILKTVSEWIFRTIFTKADVGTTDPKAGGVEIEGKLGRLIDMSTNDRYMLPGPTPFVLDEEFTRRNIRFESFMTTPQHKRMNEFLNDVVGRSMQPNRQNVKYVHRFERDSFAPLSPAGLAVLPESGQRELRQPARQRKTPSLRTTVDNRPNIPPGQPPRVLARIVKIRLADLDIWGGRDSAYDMRISVNVEVDLNNRPDLDYSLLTMEPNPADRQPTRVKNRLSYTHLGYSIDLTQVSIEGRPESQTHELEVEMDAAMVRDQALAAREGRENCYENIMEGFLSNCFLLMRVRE